MAYLEYFYTHITVFQGVCLWNSNTSLINPDCIHFKCGRQSRSKYTMWSRYNGSWMASVMSNSSPASTSSLDSVESLDAVSGRNGTYPSNLRLMEPNDQIRELQTIIRDTWVKSEISTTVHFFLIFFFNVTLQCKAWGLIWKHKVNEKTSPEFYKK